MTTQEYYFLVAAVCLALAIWFIVLFSGLCENVKELVRIERRKQGVRWKDGEFKRCDENGDFIR